MRVAARTYRSWEQGIVSARTVTDALVLDAVRDAAWTTVTMPDGTMRPKMTPEGLYGRRKMTALIRRAAIPDASWVAVDRAMRLLGLEGVRRAKSIRTTIPGKDGVRRRPPEPGLHRTAPGSHLGDGLRLHSLVGRLSLRRVHPRRVLAAHRRLACADHQTRRAGDDPAADGAVGTGPPGSSDRAQAATLTTTTRCCIHRLNSPNTPL